MPEAASAEDERFMAATIRIAERHVGLTGTNPSVGTLIVRNDGTGPIVVGRGVTALGGRPHAEPVALAEAGERAAGATAYVTLEPCAHHGRTPPCAEALIHAGIGRVVYASSDPDPRVDGRGAAMLRAAGVTVRAGVMAEQARRSLAGYLCRKMRERPHITVKTAISADGMIGRRGGGQVPITGPVANRQTHLLRARSDAIMVGAATAVEDDPSLTCRLPGMLNRSPRRLVLDPALRIDPASRLVRTARETPTLIATLRAESERAQLLREAGCELVACEAEPATGGIALPELLEDLGAKGWSSLLIEAGARLGRSLVEDRLADRIITVESSNALGEGGIPSPVSAARPPPGFRITADFRYGPDRWREFERIA